MCAGALHASHSDEKGKHPAPRLYHSKPAHVVIPGRPPIVIPSVVEESGCESDVGLGRKEISPLCFAGRNDNVKEVGSRRDDSAYRL